MPARAIGFIQRFLHVVDRGLDFFFCCSEDIIQNARLPTWRAREIFDVFDDVDERLPLLGEGAFKESVICADFSMVAV